jgi:WD40 repeat protein
MSLLNYETGHVLKQWKRAHDRDINCIIAPHPSTGIFCTGSRDCTVRLWRMQESAPVHILRGHKLNVPSITTNPEGTLLVSGSRDNTVRLWDLERGEQLSEQDVKLNIVHFVRWNAEMNCVVQGGEDLTVRLWDVRMEGSRGSLDLRQTLVNFDYHPICGEALESPESAHILYTGHNGFNQQGSMILEWDLRMGKQIRQFDGHGFTVRSLHILRSDNLKSSGLKGQLVSGSDDGTIRFWPLQDRPDGSAVTMKHEDTCRKFELQEGRITHISETSDGLVLLSLRNGTVVILKPSGNPQDPKPVQRFRYIGNPAAE